MKNSDFLQEFKDRSILESGHFRLTSGRHSSGYMQCAKVFVDPAFAARATGSLLRLVKEEVDLVISPALGGMLMGYEAARQLGVKNVFAERENKVMTLRRGFTVPKGAKVLVVEDVITTGGSVREVIALVQHLEAEAAALAVLVDRSAGVDFGIPCYSLLEVDLPAFAPADCPLCREGEAISTPGSRQ